MNIKSLTGKTMIISVAIVGGLIVGSLGINQVTASSLKNQGEASAPHYEKNASGQTYGSELYATSLETQPDLILAEGEDGTTGYVRSEDLNGDEPKSPEEALAKQKMAASFRTIPLYDADGKTVIGKFKVDKGQIGDIKTKQDENAQSK